MDDLNEAPIYTEPGNGDGGGGPTVYPVGGGPIGGGGIFGGGNGVQPVNETINSLPRWQPLLGTGATQTTSDPNVGAPTSATPAATADPLSTILAGLSAAGPLGIPVWVYLVGGIAAAYYFWPTGKKR